MLIQSPKANFIGFLVILANRNWLWLSFGLNWTFAQFKPALAPSLETLSVIISIISCSINEKSLESIILNELENSKELNLSNYNEFEWDSLIILGPYSNIEKIKMEKSIDLSNVSNSIEMLDNINLIVFLKEGKAVRYSEISRNITDFNDYQEIIKKENANFILDVNQNNSKILRIK